MEKSTESSPKKRTIIANFPSVSWQSRLAVFLAVFGFFWLFLEPLSAFQLGTSIMSSLGIWGYLSLLAFSATATFGYEFLQKKKFIGEMHLIPINLTLTETGTKHYLSTPRDMKSGIFIKKFIETLTYIPDDSLLSHVEMYDLSLLVITPEKKVVELQPALSFKESDLDLTVELECRILGKIKESLLVAKLLPVKIARPVEIVICLDVTGSMEGVINDIKTNLAGLYQNITAEYQSRGLTIYDIRIKIVAFRDFYDRAAPAIEVSPFYYLPNEKNQYQSVMDSLPATGGGDIPESSLEALAVGIMSDWDNTKNKNQLVVLITDAPPHPLEMNTDNKPAGYPKNIPQTLDDLRNLWESGIYIKNSGKKLLLVTPDCQDWQDINDSWTMVWFIDFQKVTTNKESVSAYIAKLISESMIDTQRAA